jgi:CO/xanthine dehydrogenase FAD-binding subunit
MGERNMADFTYVRAHSLQEAVDYLAEPGLTNRVLAGGTDLVNQFRSGEVACDRVVDIAHVPELKVIDVDGQVRIGAAVTHGEIAAHPVLRERVPLLAQACRQIGSPQIRNIATIGGNVVNAAACADTLPALVCLDAKAIVVNKSGETLVPVGELVTGVNRTGLAKDSLVEAFVFDVPPAGSRMDFQRIGRRRAMAIARLSVAAMGMLDEQKRVALVRLVPGAAFARFRRATDIEEMLLGQQPTAAGIQEAGRRMTELFLAESGGRWSAPYKEKTIAALTVRALSEVLRA